MGGKYNDQVLSPTLQNISGILTKLIERNEIINLNNIMSKTVNIHFVDTIPIEFRLSVLIELNSAN